MKVMEKMVTFAVLCLVVFSAVSAYGLISENNSSSNASNERIEYHYHFEANTTDDSNVTIRIPLPSKGDGSASGIARDLKLHNESTHWCIIKTEHGMAYEINFSGHASGEIIGDLLKDITVVNDIPDLYLSMDTHPEKTGKLHNASSNTRFWIYSNSSAREENLTFSLEFRYEYYNTKDKVIYDLTRQWEMKDTITQNGWCQITSTKNTSMS